ncbi:MAG: 30S ribosomal protein S20 [Candidatus Omnitrophica bacterium]|nr:30S ribosomal protein S20 [Candidatus Omnitrophota bacterium]
MAHSLSARKSIRQAAKRQVRNHGIKTEIRTRTKAVLSSIDSGEKQAAAEALKQLESKMDKALKKGVMEKNTVARKKSRLAKRLSALSA